MAVHAPITGAPSRAPGNLDGISGFLASRRSMLTGTFGAIGATMVAAAPAAATLTTLVPGEFNHAWERFATARARFDHACAIEAPEDQIDAAIDVTNDAYNALMKTPSRSAQDVASKFAALAWSAEGALVDLDEEAAVMILEAVRFGHPTAGFQISAIDA